MEGDKEGLTLMEDVIWKWLDVNGFLRHHALQRELLWKYPQRSQLFYRLMASMIVGNHRTTPLDLAYDLLT